MMRIVGHGVDLVEVARIGRLLEEHGDRFVERCFTRGERAYCEQHPRRRPEHYAARFAAKEAVLKALGTGLRDGMTWTGIEVERHPTGRPGVRLSGRNREIAHRLGVSQWQISLSHTKRYAVASAIAVGIE